MNKGWECPRCQKVHAPWVDGCDCNSGLPTTAPILPPQLPSLPIIQPQPIGTIYPWWHPNYPYKTTCGTSTVTVASENIQVRY